MAYITPCYLHISNSIRTESPYASCKGTRIGHAKKTPPSPASSNKGGCVVRCCNAASTSVSSAADKQLLFQDRRRSDADKEFLVSEFGWKVRRLARNEHEMREVAQIQAEAFHTPMALFDDLFFQFFKVFLLNLD